MLKSFRCVWFCVFARSVFVIVYPSGWTHNSNNKVIYAIKGCGVLTGTKSHIHDNSLIDGFEDACLVASEIRVTELRDYEPNYIPNDAFEAASGRYIGQFVSQDSLLVGTLYPFTNTAIGELFGQKSTRHNIKIFCTTQAHKFYWEMVNFSEPNDLQMKNVVKGGYEKGIAADLYIGKAVQDGEWKIGKVIDIIYSNRGLWIADRVGKAVTIEKFFILKYNSSDVGPQLSFT